MMIIGRLRQWVVFQLLQQEFPDEEIDR